MSLTALPRLLLAFTCTAALANSEPPAPDAVSAPMLETVVVSGEQPGPGLWKVSKGDHVLWILGTLSPVPKKITWVARDVERILDDAQEVVLAPRVSVDVDGMFGGLFLLPALLSARNNPDKQTLADMVPADLYQRWTPLKQKYLGRSMSVEKRRPIFAAQQLYEKAIDRAGLAPNNVITPQVLKLAKKRKVALNSPTITVKLAEPKQAIREFARAPLDDIDCLRKTVDRLESDLPAMQARANAWAIGDLQTLQALPYVDQNLACQQALLNTSIAHERGMGDLEQRAAAAWLDAAQGALERNRVSLALLPIARILDADGYVATLKARGYTVEAPL